MTTYTIPAVDIVSWIEAGDPVARLDLAASQHAADAMLIDVLTARYPDHTFVMSRDATLANYAYDDPDAEAIAGPTNGCSTTPKTGCASLPDRPTRDAHERTPR